MKTFLQLLYSFLPSAIRIFLLNMMGHNISRSAIIKPLAILMSKKIVIEENCKIDSFAVITGLKSLVMKKASAISRFSYISGGNLLYLDKRSLVGSRCIINTGSGDVTFGEYSVLAPRSTIYTHGTFLPVTHGYSKKNKGVQIGDYTWIMQSTSIGPGVNIGSNAIILPGSIIVKDILNDSVVYDTPTDRRIFPIDLFKKKLSDDDLKELIKEITRNYLNELIKKRKLISFEEFDNHFNINTKNLKFKVYIKPPEVFSIHAKVENINDCYFWFKMEDKLLTPSKHFILDFHRIINSNVNPPVIFKDYQSFMFYEYGLKFITVSIEK